MNNLTRGQSPTQFGAFLRLLAILLAGSIHPMAAHSAQENVVPVWSRFEQTLNSSAQYSNPIQEVTLAVTLSSPSGEKRQIFGFWDGGKTWRFRFSPNELGKWTFITACSDVRNKGLHGREGGFTCSSYTTMNAFSRHGPVRVAADHLHLEHEDGTPFFWLADSVWDGARLSTREDWSYYAAVRANQKFTAALWAVVPGQDEKSSSPFIGTERIAVQPDYFKRLDAKLEIAKRSGLLCGIAPLSELGLGPDSTSTLPENQAILLLRYAVSRWQADPVVWVLPFEADTLGKRVARWKRIGQAVFGGHAHLPVMVFPGKSQWLLDDFRREEWVDMLGCSAVNDMTEDALRWTFAGPFAGEWRKVPRHPVIPFLPRENGSRADANRRFSADEIRKAAYWSLLMTPPAGISYSAQGVVSWDSSITPASNKPREAILPLWRRSLFLAGAKQISRISDLFNSMEFWRLRPAPNFVSTQPGELSPSHYIAAAGSEAKDIAIIYVPEDRSLDASLESLPFSPQVEWINPRSGERGSAVGVVGQQSCQFPTPEAGDWLLLMKAGK
jgi:hypothetical protein